MKPLDTVRVKGSILRTTAPAIIGYGSGMRILDVPGGVVATVLTVNSESVVKLRLEHTGEVVRMYVYDLDVVSRESEATTSTEEYETQSGSE